MQTQTSQREEKRRSKNENCVIRSVGNSHAVVDDQGGREAHDVGNRHEGDELREVNKQLRGHSGELMDESSRHGFHGLELLLRSLVKKTKQDLINPV